jgi:glycosyltransferase involved in cell wall biosynthesis
VDETCGRLCPRDADALAAAAMELLGDAALRERLGRNARARAESFNWRRTAERFAGIYRAHAAMGDGEVAGVAA